MRWLPARAWENGVYAVFSNAIGVDDDTIKPGLAMILDPFGEMLAESRALGDDVVVALLTAEKLAQSSGRRYLRRAGLNCTASSSSRRLRARSRSLDPGWKVAQAKTAKEVSKGEKEHENTW